MLESSQQAGVLIRAPGNHKAANTKVDLSCLVRGFEPATPINHYKHAMKGSVPKG